MNVALQLKKIPFAKFPPAAPTPPPQKKKQPPQKKQNNPPPPPNQCWSLFLALVISCLVNIVQGGGGEVLPRFGMLENLPKTVKCVINFETDWRSFNINLRLFLQTDFHYVICYKSEGFEGLTFLSQIEVSD